MYAVQCNESIRVYDCYQYRESIKEIEGRFYDADEKCWVIPLTAQNASTLSLLGASLDESLKELAKTVRVAFVSRCEHRKPRVKAKLFDRFYRDVILAIYI